jgi:hypothetical protein
MLARGQRAAGISDQLEVSGRGQRTENGDQKAEDLEVAQFAEIVSDLKQAREF